MGEFVDGDGDDESCGPDNKHEGIGKKLADHIWIIQDLRQRWEWTNQLLVSDVRILLEMD